MPALQRLLEPASMAACLAAATTGKGPDCGYLVIITFGLGKKDEQVDALSWEKRF